MSTRNKTKEVKRGHGYLLEAWMPPAQAGEVVGCAATSFTFDPAFFVEECLGRCLGMQSDAKEDGLAHLIEREEKLAQSRCLALVDQAHADGRRTLRWDLLSARVPGAILHAKVTVLVWAAHVRVIVASANLTEPGYRTNREVFGVLDYHDGSAAPLSVLHEMLGYLRQVAEKFVEPCPARDRWMDLLRVAGKKAESWGSEKHGAVRAVLTGLGQRDVLTQMQESVWPMKRAPNFASVGSPFFDSSKDNNQPAERLWKMLDANEPEVWWEVTGRAEEESDVVYLQAPATLPMAMKALMEKGTMRRASQSFVLLNQKDEDGDLRGFHAKWLWLGSNSAAVYLIGSANFTSSGLGLNRRPNVEAGLAYIARTGPDIRALQAVCIDGDDVDMDAAHFEPIENEDEDCEGHAMLPMGFGSAVFDGKALLLSFHAGKELPAGWQALMDIPEGCVIATDQLWRSAGGEMTWAIPWNETRPPSLLVVTWPGVNGFCWWPVTLDCAAALPSPEALRNLSLDRLIEILASHRPLSEVVKRQQRREKQQLKPKDSALDAHDLVQTTHHLLPRARRVNAALAGLRRRLEQPATSLDALAWRLGHPVGAMALADALQNEAHNNEERVFLLTELMLELGHVTLEKTPPPGCLPVREIHAEIMKTQRLLWQRIEECLELPVLDTAMREHARAANDHLKL